MLQRDLPRAIAEFEQAEAGYVAAGASGYLPQVHANHAQALADAGLFDDAEALGRRGLEMLHRRWQRDRDRRGVDDRRRDPTRPARPRRRAAAAERRRRAGTASRAGTGGWRSRRAWPCRPRRGTTSHRPTSPTGSTTVADRLDGRWARRRGDSVTAGRRPGSRRVGRVAPTIRSPPTLARRIRTGRQPTASSSPTSTPLAAHRRGDRSAARRAISRGLDVGDGEPGRPRLDRDTRSRGGPRQRPGGDRGAHRGRRSGGPASCWRGSKRPA